MYYFRISDDLWVWGVKRSSENAYFDIVFIVFDVFQRFLTASEQTRKGGINADNGNQAVHAVEHTAVAG